MLYKAMIHPFLPMPIFGAIWHQGESNQAEPDAYVGAINLKQDFNKADYSSMKVLLDIN